jgi:hypothetical protein
MNKSKKNLPAADHGGKSVKGGGHPSSAPTPAQKDIDAGTGYSVSGYQNTPGIADPGVPGSRTNPVEKGRMPQPAHPHPHGQLPAKKGEPASEHTEPSKPGSGDPDLPDKPKEKMTVYATARPALPKSANRPKTKIAGSAKKNTRMQPVLTKKDANAASRPKKQSKG